MEGGAARGMAAGVGVFHGKLLLSMRRSDETRKQLRYGIHTRYAPTVCELVPTTIPGSALASSSESLIWMVVQDVRPTA